MQTNEDFMKMLLEEEQSNNSTSAGMPPTPTGSSKTSVPEKTPGQIETEELLKNALKEEKVKPCNSTVRHVMFVGQSRVGKSTMFQVLRDPTHLPGMLTLFSETDEASINSFTVEKTFKTMNEFNEFLKQNKSNKDDYLVTEENGQIKLNCTINFIDTPGLFEMKKIGEKARTNESLKKTILRCMEREIAYINAIFFVCSFETGVNVQDVESFVAFLKLFEGAEDSIAMVITRSEGYDRSDQIKLMRQLAMEPRMRPLLQKINGRVFFTGAVPRSDVEQNLVDSVGYKLNNVQQLRSTMLDNIILSNGRYQLNKIGFVSSYERELMGWMNDWLNKNELSGKNPGHEDELQADLRRLFDTIEELKCFVVSEESHDMYRQVVEKQMQHLIPRFKELFMKQQNKELFLDEKEEKEMSELRRKIEENRSFINKESEAFLSYCDLMEIEFEALCKQFDDNPGDLNVVTVLIEELRNRRYYLRKQESINEYCKILDKLRSQKK